MPRSAARPPNQLDDAIERRCSIVRYVERDLHAVLRRAEAQAHEASAGRRRVRAWCGRSARAAARSSLASSTLKAIKSSRAPIAIAPALTWRGTSPSSGSQCGIAANGRQRPALGLPRGGPVIKGRNAVARSRSRLRRDGRARPPRPGRARERNERQHVERADARMRLRGGARRSMRSSAMPASATAASSTCVCVADDRQDAAMMDGVAAAIDQARTGRFDRRDRRIDRRGIAAFRKIRHDLKQLPIAFSPAPSRSPRRCRAYSPER